MPPLPTTFTQQQIKQRQQQQTSEWNGSGQLHSPPQYSADSGIAVGGGGGGNNNNFNQQQQRHLIHQQSSESGHVNRKLI